MTLKLNVRALLVLLMAACATPSITTTAVAQDSMATMIKSKTLKVGWIPSPPGSQKDLVSGELKGYYIDMVRFILAQIGVEAQFIETTWANFPAGLQAKQFDLVAAGTFATIPRSASVTFTRPVFYLGYTAAAKAGDQRFKTLADIDKSGIKIAVVQGSGGHEFVKRTIKNAEIVAVGTSDLSMSLVQVETGRADVAVEDAWATRRYISTHPAVVDLFHDKPFNLQPIAWAMRPGETELRIFFDQAIEWMRINGKLEEIVRSYPASSRYIVKDTYLSLD